MQLDVPVAGSPDAAIESLDRDLPLVLGKGAIDAGRWARPDRLTLLVPMFGGNPRKDPYLLRLHFGYYPAWPPSAQFINPETCCYDATKDRKWLPLIEGCSQIQVHASYNPGNGGSLIQLICCSVTLEFYLVRHDVQEKHIWDAKSQNFAATIIAIDTALGSTFYKGRQS